MNQSPCFENIVGNLSSAGQALLRQDIGISEAAEVVDLGGESLSVLRQLAQEPAMQFDNQPIVENDFEAISEFRRVNNLKLDDDYNDFHIIDGRVDSLRCVSTIAHDIAHLGWLTKATLLYLDGNYIENFSALENVTSLKSLLIDNNQRTNFSTLSGLRLLSELSAVNTGIIDLSWIEGITDIRSLNVRSNPIESIKPLSLCPHLESLSIARTNVD